MRIPPLDSRAQFNCTLYNYQCPQGTLYIGRFNSKISEQAILHISDRPWWFAVYRTIYTQHGPYGSKMREMQQQMVMSTYIQREHTIYSKQDLIPGNTSIYHHNTRKHGYTQPYHPKAAQNHPIQGYIGGYTGFP